MTQFVDLWNGWCGRLPKAVAIGSDQSNSTVHAAISQTKSELSSPAIVLDHDDGSEKKSDASQSAASASSHERREDNKQLRDLGYTQELRRGLNAFMNFSFTFTICAVLPGILQLWNYGLNTGGPIVIIWSWLVGGLFMTITAVSLGEICSVYPLAGSVYHWTAALVPKDADGRNVGHWQWLVYLTGWNNLFGNIANSASFASGTATVISAALAMNSANSLSISTQVAIGIALIWFWALLNLLKIDQQGMISALAAVFQIFGACFIVIVVLILCPEYQTNSFVWTQFYNGTGISQTSYVSAIGLLMVLYSFDGFDAAGHVAEETRGAHRAAPIAMLYACAASLVSGLFVILGLLYCTPTNSYALTQGYPSGIDFALSNQCSDPTCDGLNPNGNIADATGVGSAQQAAVNIFWYVGGLKWGTTLTALLAVLIYCSGSSAITAASRITFAMARDGALPFSNVLTYVYKQTLSPVASVIFVALCDSLLLLLQLGNSTAFAAIVSISTIGFQLSYAAPIFLRITTAKDTFQPKSFSLGRFSLICGWISVIWCIATAVLLFLPQTMPVTTMNMNYTCAVIGALWTLALIYWWTVARKRFVGPLTLQRSRNGNGNAQTNSHSQWQHGHRDDHFEKDNNAEDHQTQLMQLSSANLTVRQPQSHGGDSDLKSVKEKKRVCFQENVVADSEKTRSQNPILASAAVEAYGADKTDEVQSDASQVIFHFEEVSRDVIVEDESNENENENEK